MDADHQQINDYRTSIDNIDASLVFLLAERFRITDKVGQFKAENDLPPVDPVREERQAERIRGLARSVGFDPELAQRILSFIVNEVVRRHERMSRTEQPD